MLRCVSAALVAAFLLLGLSQGFLATPASASPDVRSLVTAAAQRHGVPPALAHQVAHGESNHRCDAANKFSSARGVFQIIAATGRGLGINRFDCHQNIDGGVRLLRQVMHSPSRLCATYEAMCSRSVRKARLARHQQRSRGRYRVASR